MVFSFTLVFINLAQYFLDLSNVRTENRKHDKDRDRDKNNSSDDYYGENGDISSELAHLKPPFIPQHI